MLRKKTLLILGAGSSKDFNFPLGPELTDRIAQAVTFDFSQHKPVGGHSVIRARLETMLYSQGQLFNLWASACEYIQRNIHLSSSVDRFIDSNRDNQAVVLICKFAIALIIADCEKASAFGGAPEGELARFDFKNLKSAWTTKLFYHLHANISAKELDQIFDCVRVVTFNYDRVFEQALAVEIANFYSRPMHDAHAAIANLGVVHVYGSLGALSQRGPGYRQFGQFGNNPDDALKSIRTFHESVSSEIADRVGEFIGWADRVFVLGFSYADMNTDFLARCAPEKRRLTPVFGTCLNMSEQNVEVARHRMDGIFAKHSNCTRMLDVDCGRFFEDLALTI